MINKIKIFIRRLIIKVRYKYNWYSKKVIVVNDDYRQIGLSTMIIKDALKKDIKIFVPNHMTKMNLMKKMYEIDNDYPTLKSVSSYNDYFITPTDLCRDTRLVDNRILVDNQCTPSDILSLKNNGLYQIANGFVYIPYAK